MGMIIEVDETDLPQNEHHQLIYKLERVKQYLNEACIGYKMIETNVNVEEGEFLLTNGLAFAKSFNEDALLMVKGPNYIDWM